MSIQQRAFDTLVQDIVNKASLSQKEATGFFAVYCPICKKMEKKTGGFKFEDDKVVYNCFRGSCDASCVYELGKPVSRKFKALMESINVMTPVELRMVKSSFQKAMESLDEDLYKKNKYRHIQFPDGFVPFDDGKASYQEFWATYFERRHCPYDDVLIANKGQYRGCVAIPMYHYENLIAVQIITTKGVYVMHGGGNSNVLYFPDGIPQDNPIIVVEGTLDAKCFPNTVGTLKSRITPEQAYHLRGKDVIMLPDRTGNHYIDYYKKYGWKMCIPPWDEKDLNLAVCKYGVLVVARMIRENTFSDPLKIDVMWRKWAK